MVPKPGHPRLSNSMQLMDVNWQTEAWQRGFAAFVPFKESPLKLSLETRNLSDVVIVHCQGRIVYRDEAAALSRVCGELLEHGSKLVLDLSGVSAMDGAGIGELALLQSWALEKNATLKCAGASPLVQELLCLTNLDTVVEMYDSADAALESFDEEMCADS
jgi:anti-sigma B factor antagonist